MKNELLTLTEGSINDIRFFKDRIEVGGTMKNT